MKNIILTGSIAFDNLMQFEGRFKDSILKNELDHLSVSFLAPDREVFQGGCAANVAYALALLQEAPAIVGVAGNDFSDYRQFLDEHNVFTECIKVSEDATTAAAFILTDNDNNQISIFSPGAMSDLDLSMELGNCECVKNAFCALISPGMPQRMLSLAQSCIDKNIPFIFDPGQAIAALDPDSMGLLVDCCWGMVTNEYEAELIERKLNLDIKQIATKAGFWVITKGKEGCEMYKGGDMEEVLSVPDLAVVDVTGAGDAFRAGLVHGLHEGNDLRRSCEMGNVVASFSVLTRGTQTYTFSMEEFNERLEKYY